MKTKLINALNSRKLSAILNKISQEELSFLYQYFSSLRFNYGFGLNIEQKIQKLKTELPLINDIIKFEIIADRVNRLSKNEKLEFLYNKKTEKIEYGVTLATLIPELQKIYDKIHVLYFEMPIGIHKAELWLYPIALNPDINSDFEAIIYFKTANKYIDKLENINISELWRRQINKDITFSGLISEIVISEAKQNKITIKEAATILKFNNYLRNFFSTRDEKRDFIDFTLIRTFENFNLIEFTPWVQSIIKEINEIPIHGIDRIAGVWYLFFLCRSNYVIENANRLALETILYSLSQGSIIEDKPWKINSRDRENPNRIVDYIPIASILIFANKRIKPITQSNEIIENATKYIQENQEISGGWKIESIDTNPDILSTCFAVYALIFSKPKGWEDNCIKAKFWLLSKQSDVGCWYIEGGPTVMITTIVLETLKLIDGDNSVSFNLANAPLEHWLSKYSKSHILFLSAVDKYEKGIYQRNLIDDLRLAIELLLKEKLNNQKPLEKQVSELGQYLKVNGNSSHIRNMFHTLLEYYSKYQNEHAKHDDSINKQDAELIYDLSISFMKFIVNV
jgi:hypothetical protein